MKTNPGSVEHALQNARLGVQQGDRQAARRWAEAAIAIDRDQEDAWLILAAVGSTRASIEYLEQALRINPHSERARKGMRWAVDRMRKESGNHQGTYRQADEAEQGGTFRPIAIIKEETQSRVEVRHLESLERAGTAPNPPIFKSLSKYRWSFLTLLVLAVCVAAILALWPGYASPVQALLHFPQSSPSISGASIEVDKPTYTATYTSTFTPTNTFTPTQTSTFTPSPTETFTPSPSPFPTDTPAPLPTDPVVVYPDNNGDRWIDVNLSQQMLYAYEGDTVVASFLVSTGVSAFPTVTGQFHTYIKLVSTLMAGDGYYLPNVPYTMYFYKGYGIHGTYWHNNFGHPMSHGCVNMYTPDAEWMFYWAPLGTLVNIHY